MMKLKTQEAVAKQDLGGCAMSFSCSKSEMLRVRNDPWLTEEVWKYIVEE